MRTLATISPPLCLRLIHSLHSLGVIRTHRRSIVFVRLCLSAVVRVGFIIKRFTCLLVLKVSPENKIVLLRCRLSSPLARDQFCRTIRLSHGIDLFAIRA